MWEIEGLNFRTLAVHLPELLYEASTTALTGRAVASRTGGQGLQWAALIERPISLDFDGLGDSQRIFQFDAQILDRTVHLGVAK